MSVIKKEKDIICKSHEKVYIGNNFTSNEIRKIYEDGK